MTTHGGRRPGAGRPPGIPNPNAGRPQTTKKVSVGQQMLMQRHAADGQGFYMPEVWEIVAVSRTYIDLVVKGTEAEGETIRLLFA